jgi:hypothetical protein
LALKILVEGTSAVNRDAIGKKINDLGCVNENDLEQMLKHWVRDFERKEGLKIESWERS